MTLSFVVKITLKMTSDHVLCFCLANGDDNVMTEVNRGGGYGLWYNNNISNYTW